jgi:TM2 domain-containing membrane protein YozV
MEDEQYQTKPSIEQYSTIEGAHPNWAPASNVQAQVVARSPVLYVLASVFFPGLGTGLNGKWGKGALFFFGQFICIPLILVFGLGLIGLFGIRIWACIDAYNETQAWNLAHGLVT